MNSKLFLGVCLVFLLIPMAYAQFSDAYCSSNSISTIRSACGDPADGRADNDTLPSQLNACLNRGQEICDSPVVSLTHPSQTNAYTITPNQNTTFDFVVEQIQNVQTSRPADFLIVLDISDSMNDFQNGRTKLDWAMRQINQEYDLLASFDNARSQDYYQLGITTYNHDASVNQFLRKVDISHDRFSNPFLHSVNACGCKDVSQGILNATTRHFDTVEGLGLEGFSLSCDDGRVEKVMIIISDGAPNRGDSLMQALSAGVDSTGITYHTIGINPSSAWADELRDVAQNWGTGQGLYWEATGFNRLGTEISEIFDLYRFPTLEFPEYRLELAPEFEYVEYDEFDFGSGPMDFILANGYWGTLDGQSAKLNTNYNLFGQGGQDQFTIPIRPKPGTPPGVYKVLNTSLSEVIVRAGCGYRLPFNDIFVEIVPSICGNDIVEDVEACDDGNTDDGDGCSSICQIEFDPPRTCGDGQFDPDGPDDIQGTIDDEYCDDGPLGSITCTPQCTPRVVNLCSDNPLCGNGITDGAEQCDDSNRNNGDGCSSLCTVEFCGDGVADANGPDNVDGNADDERCEPGLYPGCTANCKLP